jgi:hypothetical protein
VNGGLDDHHAEGRGGHGKSGERRGQPLHDGVDDEALFHDDGNRSGEANEKCGVGH